MRNMMNEDDLPANRDADTPPRSAHTASQDTMLPARYPRCLEKFLPALRQILGVHLERTGLSRYLQVVIDVRNSVTWDPLELTVCEAVHTEDGIEPCPQLGKALKSFRDTVRPIADDLRGVAVDDDGNLSLRGPEAFLRLVTALTKDICETYGMSTLDQIDTVRFDARHLQQLTGMEALRHKAAEGRGIQARVTDKTFFLKNLPARPYISTDDLHREFFVVANAIGRCFPVNLAELGTTLVEETNCAPVASMGYDPHYRAH